VTGAVSKFGSDAWIPDLRNLCIDYLKYQQVKRGCKFLKFSDEIGEIDKPGRIVKEYHRTATILKLNIYGDDAEHKYMDNHKIAALYIRSFLKYKPFYLDIPSDIKNPEINIYAKSANEYFVIPYLEAVFKGWKSDFDGVLRMEPVYQDSFIRLLYQYTKDIKKIDPASFSNTICLIEKQYFKQGVL